MMVLIVPLIIIALLILVNGLFVAAEFSIIGARPARIEQLSKDGNRAARWVDQILQDRTHTDRYIATAQLGITLASVGLGMYAEPAIAHLIEEPLHDWLGLEGAIVHTIAFLVALIGITYLHVVVGEMVPKSIALQGPERTVLTLSAVMRIVGKLFSIPVSILNRIGLITLKLLRVPPPGAGSRLYSLDELEMVVLESYTGGLLDQREQELVANILDFSEERVEQVMIPRTLIAAIPLTIPEQQLLDLIPTSAYSRFPVYRGTIDNIVGMLHMKDLVRQQLAGEPFDLPGLLRKVLYVPDTLPVKSLLASFKRLHQHMAIVIDEHGGTLGLVTLEDLLEEVVGDVRDEFDKGEEPLITVVEPGYLIALGLTQLDDLAAYVPIPEHGYDVATIGGLVLAELGRRPKVGDEIRRGDIVFRVVDVDRLAITRLSIHFPPSAASDVADPSSS
jgi:CBS domain containing-hemolysin-like protein